MTTVGWSHRSRTVALIVSLCPVLSGAALAAEGEGTAIEGRWETARKDLALDIGRCGDGYCGQLVTADNRCDRTVLTVAVKSTQPTWLQFGGDLALPNASRPHFKVRVSLVKAADEKPASMMIVGDVVDPDPMRRTFPYRARLARVGEATCRPRTTS